MHTNQFWLVALNILLTLSFLVLLIPILTLFIESICACLNKGSIKFADRNYEESSQPTVAVLIPAHNEAFGIEKTLLNLLPQITKQDRLVVVADNCTDNTAEIARKHGAIVIERKNEDLRGKGFALDYGLKFLESNPPQVVVVVDADCIIQKGSIRDLAQLAFSSKQPVQAIYLLELPENPSPKDLVSVLAFTVKNLVRPLGLRYLNLPCTLAGTGMVFEWSTIKNISLASDNLVEDMQMSIDLAIKGFTTLLCPTVKVTAREAVTKGQRTRWEHGHLKMIRSQVPRLAKAAIAKRRLDLLALSLDLFVPPLSLLVMFWSAAVILSLLNIILGLGWTLSILLAAEGFVLFLSIFVAYVQFARQDISIKSFALIPFYLLWKIPLYFSFLFKPQTKWIRSARGDE